MSDKVVALALHLPTHSCLVLIDLTVTASVLEEVL